MSHVFDINWPKLSMEKNIILSIKKSFISADGSLYFCEWCIILERTYIEERGESNHSFPIAFATAGKDATQNAMRSFSFQYALHIRFVKSCSIDITVYKSLASPDNIETSIVNLMSTILPSPQDGGLRHPIDEFSSNSTGESDRLVLDTRTQKLEEMAAQQTMDTINFLVAVVQLVIGIIGIIGKHICPYLIFQQKSTTMQEIITHI